MNNSEKQIETKGAFTDQLSLEDLLLIKGTFTPNEAREVLMSLVRSKISFHKKKNLQSYEHHGKEDLESKQRIEELEKMREKLLKIFKNADEEGVSIKIESQIDIQFMDNSR